MPKISALPLAGPPGVGDLLVLDQGLIAKQITFNTFQSAVANAGIVQGLIQASPQWKTPPFNASDFLGGGGMIWTVSIGNLTTFRYYISGKVMVLDFQIENTSVSAPLANELAFRLPEGKSTPGFVGSPLGRLVDNGAAQVACYFSTSVNNTVLGINRLDGANFQSSAALTSIYGQCIVEIN